MKEQLRVSETAEILKVHPETVRRLDRRGVLASSRDYLNHRVFKLTDVLRYKEKREGLNDGNRN